VQRGLCQPQCFSVSLGHTLKRCHKLQQVPAPVLLYCIASPAPTTAKATIVIPTATTAGVVVVGVANERRRRRRQRWR
jgi:hypothetical protein